MSDSPLHTVQLQQFVERWQAGDAAAANDLFRVISVRLEQLVRRMLRHFPGVRHRVETGDIVQGATWRLLQSLQKLRPDTTRDFYGLLSVHIRRELIDLARRYRGKSQANLDECEPEQTAALDAPAEEMEQWSRLHEAVEQLGCEEREVFSLVFYHGWTQPQIAELFSVNERTIRRRWQSACLHLSDVLGGRLPEV